MERKYRGSKKLWLCLAVLWLCLAAAGCRGWTEEAGRTAGGPGAETGESQAEISGAGGPGAEGGGIPGREGAPSRPEGDGTDKRETKERAQEPVDPPQGSGGPEETEGGQEAETPLYRIILATDLHYLAEELAGNRGQSYIHMAYSGDGSVLLYQWEVVKAFVEDMKEKQPDLLILSGDLTLNGEKASHEELASILGELTEEGIPVAVIPGNHDIQNPQAKSFGSQGTERTESITAKEFREIYADCGYVAADSRDPDSLSYLYKLDGEYWILMLDSCQYEPYNQVGGMIRRGTYDWMEPILREAWEEGAEVITVTHHNLLEQSGVSEDFYDNCTIEHNEELVELLYDNEVRLHLSGHLHLQHYMEEEGITEAVTGSLLMAPCRYGVLDLYGDHAVTYHTEPVNVEKWAEENHYKNRDLADFTAYSEEFLRSVSYEKAAADLKKHILSGELKISDRDMDEMARFYAKLCVYYYGGRMYEITEDVASDPAFELWDRYQYVSELSDFLRRILEDETKNFSKFALPAYTPGQEE